MPFLTCPVMSRSGAASVGSLRALSSIAVTAEGRRANRAEIREIGGGETGVDAVLGAARFAAASADPEVRAAGLRILRDGLAPAGMRDMADQRYVGDERRKIEVMLEGGGSQEPSALAP